MTSVQFRVFSGSEVRLRVKSKENGPNEFSQCFRNFRIRIMFIKSLQNVRLTEISLLHPYIFKLMR